MVARRLKEIDSELCSLHSLQINDSVYEIEYLGGGDMVFIANVTGVNTNFNNSEYQCVWCKRPRSTFGNSKECWPIAGEGARTLAEATRLHEEGLQQYGYVNKPVVTCIEFCNYVMDVLHLIINVGRKLIELLFAELLTYDNLKTNNAKDLSKLLNVNKLNIFLVYLLKVSHAITAPNQNSKNFNVSSFTGAKYLKILESIDIPNLFEFSSGQNLIKIQQIWKKFYEIIINIKENNWNHLQLQTETRIFYQLFLEKYLEKHVTPYIHGFVDHMHQFMELHGNIYILNCEGLEKANHFNTQCYHRRSNKHKTEETTENDASVHDHYLEQILKKKHRLVIVFTLK